MYQHHLYGTLFATIFYGGAKNAFCSYLGQIGIIFGANLAS